MERIKKCICGETDPDNFYEGYATKCKNCKKEDKKNSYYSKRKELDDNLFFTFKKYYPQLLSLSSDKELVKKIGEFILNTIVEEAANETFSKK